MTDKEFIQVEKIGSIAENLKPKKEVLMKKAILIISLFLSSCTYQYTPITQEIITLPEPSSTPAQAAKVIQEIQAYHSREWVANIQRIKDTYSRVIKRIEDKESVDFTVAFFKAISLEEDLAWDIRNLSTAYDYLPNTEALKFFYAAEKRLNAILEIVAPFTLSSDSRAQTCAREAVKYFECQKELLMAIRDIDYRNLKPSDVPTRIPSEILRLNAKLREQQDQLFQAVFHYYNNLA